VPWGASGCGEAPPPLPLPPPLAEPEGERSSSEGMFSETPSAACCCAIYIVGERGGCGQRSVREESVAQAGQLARPPAHTTRREGFAHQRHPSSQVRPVAHVRFLPRVCLLARQKNSPATHTRPSPRAGALTHRSVWLVRVVALAALAACSAARAEA
jgi:hypothetical protein